MRAGHDMRHVTLHLMREDLPQASLAMAELDGFAPDDRPLLAAQMPEVPGHTFRILIQEARRNYQRLVALVGEPEEPEPYLILRQEQLQQLHQWLDLAWSQCSRCETTLHALEERSTELEYQIQSLQEFMDLNIDLGELHHPHHFIDLFIGTLPATNLERLREALALSGHLILHDTGDQNTRRIVIAGLQRDGDQVSDVLASAGFHPIPIPASFQDEPEKIRAELREEYNDLIELQEMMYSELENWRDSNQRELVKARQLLDAAEPYVQVDQAARAQGSLAVLQGWISDARIEEARDRLQQHLKLPFLLETRRPHRAESALVPVPPAQSPWLKAFSALVHQYGVPRFGEFDPTLLFAITFAAMFGMMFGDVGHGLVFMGVGLLARRWLGIHTVLPVFAGAFATLFGFLYGSVFGNEHWLTPLWVAPMSNPRYMLTVGLAWGVIFLSLGSIIAVYNRLRANDVIAALFDAGGLLSLVFYYGLLGGLYNLAQGDDFGLEASTVVLLSLAPLVFYRWHETDAPPAERLLTVAVELFELVIGYLTSSLSFLRVAAFSINHVALSLAVFTLANMSHGFGHWITLLLGNVFILILEGIIVAIQALRLEYYEGFSRYFYADGRPFKPLRLVRHKSPGLFSKSAPGKRVRNEVSL